MQDNMMLSFIPPNERHKRLRKLVVAQLRPTAISEYFHPVQRVEIHRLVNSLIEDPNDWKSYIAKALASIVRFIIGQVTLGAESLKDHDDNIRSPHQIWPGRRASRQKCVSAQQ